MPHNTRIDGDAETTSTANTRTDGNVEETFAAGDADTTLMIAVTQALSNYLRYIPVSAEELPSLVRDVARRVAPQVPATGGQTRAPPEKPRRRRTGSTAEVQEPVPATELMVHDDATSAHKTPVVDDAIDLAKV